MDNNHEHTRNSTRRFIMINNIEHFETPSQSPDLMPIEIIKKCIIFNGIHGGHRVPCMAHISLSVWYCTFQKNSYSNLLLSFKHLTDPIHHRNSDKLDNLFF